MIWYLWKLFAKYVIGGPVYVKSIQRYDCRGDRFKDVTDVHVEQQEFESRKLKHFKTGESGWTVPWAIWKNAGQFWVDAEYCARDEKRGDASVLCTRKEDGSIDVVIPHGEVISDACSGRGIRANVLRD